MAQLRSHFWTKIIIKWSSPKSSSPSFPSRFHAPNSHAEIWVYCGFITQFMASCIPTGAFGARCGIFCDNHHPHFTIWPLNQRSFQQLPKNTRSLIWPIDHGDWYERKWDGQPKSKPKLSSPSSIQSISHPFFPSFSPFTTSLIDICISSIYPSF